MKTKKLGMPTRGEIQARNLSQERRERLEAVGPHWKVRLFFTTGAVHVISRIEPVLTFADGKISNVEMEIIEGTEFGDTLGFVLWETLATASWRFEVPD